MRSPGAHRDIAKVKKSKTALNPVKVAQSFKAFQPEETLGGVDPGQVVEVRHAGRGNQMDAAGGDLKYDAMGNLVGAQGEPHQEK
jgi:hypothetical protein